MKYPIGIQNLRKSARKGMSMLTRQHRLQTRIGGSALQTPQYIYIFELKINQNADVSLRQIDEKGYAAPFASDGRKLFKIGVNFSTDKKKIDDWKIA